jgi:hypothetical protein
MRISYCGIFMAAALALMACGDEDNGTNTPGTPTEREVGKPMTVDAGEPADCTPANAALIEVTSPVKGTVLVPGDTVVVRWRSVVADFSSYDVYASVNGGQDWTQLNLDESVPKGSESDEAQCFSYTTIVPKDGSFTPDGEDNAALMFRIKDYSSTKAIHRDASDSLTVLAP